jgi:uncharacterized protein (DUF305 family)
MTLLIDKRNNIINNINKIYMALYMATTMGLIHTAVMLYEMYNVKDLILLLVFLVASIVLAFMIRKQIGSDENQFMKSMIEHHSMALQMVKSTEDKFDDPRLIQLGENISKSQSIEIKQMKSILRERGAL